MLRPRRTLARTVALTGAAVLVGVLGLAAPAAAHITVHPEQAEAGDYPRLDFRVPSESDTASTVQVELVLPEDALVASVSLARVPGWTSSVEKVPVDPPLEVHGAQVTEAVSRIVWTADNPEVGVQPGEFIDFPVRMGPLPDAEQMVFKSLQTYSDGGVVRWIEVPVPGEDEPATPATVLTLVPAGEGTSAPGAAPATGEDTSATDGDDDTAGGGAALGVGVAGLLAGLGGLLFGGLAFIRARRTEPAGATGATPPASGGSAD
ncbi:YcnI family copper-binding membrane protein [Micromonospora sp. NBC_01813]|uniref:YcnI family copper-binding membrane protein n=1 Tax=Micromonospora sp. NBC_01813 TaxID=2975988 RepID=UPI002DD7B3ED|nr:YcnI family protein [Micromonospora sp. NBC_01813]WSA12090.1 YcnI family protein [Micromonospora sp. NBC_01813]